MANVNKSRSCYVNVFMLLSLCLSCSQRPFRACEIAVQLKYSGALALDPTMVIHNTTLKFPAACSTSLWKVAKIL